VEIIMKNIDPDYWDEKCTSDLFDKVRDYERKIQYLEDKVNDLQDYIESLQSQLEAKQDD
jgi:chaperonin cofactor prefoldin